MHVQVNWLEIHSWRSHEPHHETPKLRRLLTYGCLIWCLASLCSCFLADTVPFVLGGNAFLLISIDDSTDTLRLILDLKPLPA